MVWFSLAETVVGIFDKVLDKAFVDKDEKLKLDLDRDKLRAEVIAQLQQNEKELLAITAEVHKQVLENDKTELEVRGRIVEAEQNSEHGYKWALRPTLGWLSVVVIAFKYLLLPIIGLIFFGDLDHLMQAYEIPHEMWSTIEIVSGGYVFSRMTEKVASNYFQSKAQK